MVSSSEFLFLHLFQIRTFGTGSLQATYSPNRQCQGTVTATRCWHYYLQSCACQIQILQQDYGNHLTLSNI